MISTVVKVWSNDQTFLVQKFGQMTKHSGGEEVMRYAVSDRFYELLVALYGVAIEDNDTLEIDLAASLIKDTERGQNEVTYS